MTKCDSSCVIAKICESRVLTCSKSAINQPILERANCKKKNKFVSIESDTPSIIDYVDPGIFDVLVKDGMTSLLIGFGVKYIRRYTFKDVPNNSGLTLLLNGQFIIHIEDMAFEEKMITPLFYSNPTLKKFANRSYETSFMKKKVYCDSSSSKCLCKETFDMNSTKLPTFTWYFNESFNFCKTNHIKNCMDPSCKLPLMTEHSASLEKLSRKTIVPDDYCFNSSMFHHFQASILWISLSLLLPAFT